MTHPCTPVHIEGTDHAHRLGLDLGRSYVSPAAARQLQKALPNTEVIADYPRGDQFLERYVSIGE